MSAQTIALSARGVQKSFGSLVVARDINIDLPVGARYALIFGDDEIARGEVALKDLRDAAAAQRSLPLAGAAAWAADLATA